MPPGTLVYSGDSNAAETKVCVFSYSPAFFKEKEKITAEELIGYKKDTTTVEWINVNSVHDISLIEKIGRIYHLHPLLLEDIVSLHQRPKIDEYQNCLFVVVKMLLFNQQTNEINTEQVSFVLLDNTVITFQEKEGDIFNFIRDRLRLGKGRIRTLKADYLLYSLLDTIVDNYFNILEKIDDNISAIESDLIDNHTNRILTDIHKLKNEMILVKKEVWPLREVVSNFIRNDYAPVTKETRVYLRDLYDHVVQAIDLIETNRDILGNLVDMYHSNLSNKMNQVMKMLTMIATVFIPLTFIAGVYGMNFKYMPELEWKYGYPLIWVIMLSVAAIMIYYFRKKRWM